MLSSGLLVTSIAFGRPPGPNDLPASVYLHPQQMVTVSPGRRLNLYCIGEGSPTVLFDSGLGDGTLSWRSVQGVVAKMTRACSYDRANYFYSDTVERNATAQASVDDLLALVDSAHLGNRIILVGHSRGGLNARLFVYEHLNRLAGLVLVDPTITQRLVPASTPDYVRQYESYLARGQQLRGCYEAAANRELREDSPDPMHCLDELDPQSTGEEKALAEAVRHMETRPIFQATLFSERQHLFYPIDDRGDSTDGALIAQHRHSMGDLPFVVIAADWFKSASFKGQPSREQASFLRWNMAQMRELTSESNRGQLVIAASRHYVQQERPDLVVDAIQQVLNQARGVERGAVESP
ncbi:alpha/beta hydrolase [Dyella sp. GSA-30]|uniref:alpha/beta fold hydrolase n=1 Tax=Dyella sp. GSA-30 TaxID=2994496 RepID=UPI0024917491|nr:alpha/beta hydrolase [Dyella sp. GSA-30]BDU19063.1 hydrolase or acyltransferase of alpha/beta superfamily protein [Dyella sp. GSA-30]